MKKVIHIVVILLIAAISTTASVVSAASPQDVKKFINTMNNNRSKLLKFKKHNNGTLETVYVINKKRYTAACAGDRIFFYIRPDGTRGDRYLEMVGGNNGKADWGAKGTTLKRTFDPNANIGLEHQQYWQTVYDAAIADALNHFQN